MPLLFAARLIDQRFANVKHVVPASPPRADLAYAAPLDYHGNHGSIALGTVPGAGQRRVTEGTKEIDNRVHGDIVFRSHRVAAVER